MRSSVLFLTDNIIAAAFLFSLGCSGSSADSADNDMSVSDSDKKSTEPDMSDQEPGTETDEENDTGPVDTASEESDGTTDTQDSAFDSESEMDIDADTDTDTDADTDTDTDTDSDADTSTEDSQETDTNTNTNTDMDTLDEDPVTRTCFSDCLDFPETPIFKIEVSSDELALFKNKDNFTTPGPCVVEPQLSDDNLPGALFPADWLRPRFRFTPLDKEDLFEIRLQAEREKYDLVVYTKETLWTIPKDIWDGLTQTVIDEPISVTVRGINSLSPSIPSGTRGTFQIAPVKAGGKILYLAASSSYVTPESDKLTVLSVGEEDVADALTVNDVGDRDILAADGQEERAAAYGVDEGCVQCIGCHAAAPDGAAVAFGDHWPWNVVVASIENEETSSVAVGNAPTYLSRGAEVLLNQPWLGMPTFSKAHYNSNERILVTTYGERTTAGGGPVGFTFDIPTDSILVWFDLMTDVSIYVSPDYPGNIGEERNRLVSEAFGIGFGFLALSGETLSAAAPDWSNDGSNIVYTAASVTQDGRLGGGVGQTDVDLHVVPYNDGQGGTVSCIEGACEKDAAEYYPAYSPDDRLIAFNKEESFRATKTVTTSFVSPYDVITINGSTADVYYRPHAEIFFIPAIGGTPVRLMADDPPRCTGETSPGIINSRPKWSPDVKISPSEFGQQRSFYWLVFSSARSYPEQFIVESNLYSPKDNRSSQLYAAAVVRDEKTGEYVTYPAIYLWNQKKDTSNLSPTWDNLNNTSAMTAE